VSEHVLGHKQVEQRFTEALHSKRLHHAWLLYGMKGIGKRMLAEQLAALAMCESHTACGHCHGCRMLAAGSHPDVVRVGLIEGKRDVNIEQIRDLLGFMSLSGSESERRLVILDDAERMNNQAANALLKGLEEPAAGSVLLMVCADLERLPATIRSRCMLQQCMPLAAAEVRSVAITLLANAKKPLDAAVLELAVELADGCPGRIACMQDAALANALIAWQQLIGDAATADVGEVEAWIRKNVALVPHDLIVRMVLLPLYPLLQQASLSFAGREALFTAMHSCGRWPSDVVSRSLRAAPSLLAVMLSLRAAIKTLPAR